MARGAGGVDDMFMVDFALLLREQDGVVSRVQVLESGATTTHLNRMLRRSELFVVHAGVYVEHNGPLSWQQRAWAAVLYAAPAALCLTSALRGAEGPGRRSRDVGVIHVAVDGSRRVREVVGVDVHRMAGLSERVQGNTGPPRVRYDDSVLDVAAAARTDLDAVAALADACGGRRTTAARLLALLGERRRIARRAWLASVLRDVAEGTCSVLEHGYLDRVVRPHGLPRGRLQAPGTGSSGRVYRDVAHDDLLLLVELDGRLFHTSATDRDRDLDRDLDAAAIDGRVTLRLGFGQVFERSCETAVKVGAVMNRLGWTGQATPCPRCQS